MIIFSRIELLFMRIKTHKAIRWQTRWNIEWKFQSLTGLECGHRFCATCWGMYLTTKVMEEGRGQSIACPEHNCDILVDDAKAMELITDEKVKRRYQHLITNSFVEVRRFTHSFTLHSSNFFQFQCNRLLKWCPGTDCGRAVKVPHYDVRPVTCNCGITFWWACCYVLLFFEARILCFVSMPRTKTDNWRHENQR